MDAIPSVPSPTQDRYHCIVCSSSRIDLFSCFLVFPYNKLYVHINTARLICTSRRRHQSPPPSLLCYLHEIHCSNSVIFYLENPSDGPDLRLRWVRPRQSNGGSSVQRCRREGELLRLDIFSTRERSLPTVVCISILGSMTANCTKHSDR